MDLDKYLERIRYNGPVNTESSTLQALCEHMSYSVPFDTLDMFGGTRKIIDLQKIYNDIVTRRRGGFCYENNGLFCWCLRKFGFQADMLQAQAWVKHHMNFDPKFDHMVLMVTLKDGSRWLVDQGWSTNCFIHPLRFVMNEAQPQVSGNYRITRWKGKGEYYMMEKQKKNIITSEGSLSETPDDDLPWEVFYRFDLEPRKLNDYIEMCAFQQDDAASFLKHNTLCNVKRKDGCISMWGRVFTDKRFIWPNAEQVLSVETATNDQEWKDLLKKHFDITLDFDAIVQDLHYRP